MFDDLKRLFGNQSKLTAHSENAEKSSGVWLDGAYRTHKEIDVARFTALAADAFPNMRKRICCFGADWLGRQFASDQERIVGGRPQVLLLEPGTGEALEIPADPVSFHENELMAHPDAVAAYPFFQRWLRSGGPAPGYNQCVGYKIPLFLEGADEITNLEMSDFDVYWTISAQTLSKVRGMSVGTRISRVEIGKEGD